MQYPGSNLPPEIPSLIEPDVSELEGIETPQVATLENLMIHANRSKEIEAQIEVYNGIIKALKEEQEKIEEAHIPQVMDQLGMSDFKLKDGSKIELTPTFQGTLVVKDEDQRKYQLGWLVANEGQDLIKNTFTLTFPKGRDEEAKALRELLKEYEFDFTVDETVHAGSLGSFIKAMIKKGKEVPLDTLKWRYFQKAKIKAVPK